MNWFNPYYRCTRLVTLTLSLIVLLAVLIGGGQPALAHRPHHVVTEVQISPRFSEDETLFIVVRNNLYKSIDAGNSWQRLVDGLDSQNLSGLALSQQNRERLYLSTRGDGVYRSTDGGLSWTQQVNGLGSRDLEAIAVSPDNDELLLVAGHDGGLYRSDNGGDQWQSVWMENQRITSLSFTPDNPQVIFVGTAEGEVHRSDDAGTTWVRSSQLDETGAITAIAPSTNFSQDNQLWLGTETAGVFSSSDGGNQFTAINSDLPDLQITDLLALAPDGGQPQLLLSTWDAGFFRSDDGGQTWNPAQGELAKDVQADELEEPHFYGLATSPAALAEGYVFMGGFDSLYRSEDGGQQWQQLETLSPDVVMAFDISPNYAQDQTLALGTYVNGIYLTKDGGQSWQRPSRGLHLPWFTNNFEQQYQDPRRYFHVAFSPNYGNDQTLFVSILWTKLLRSTDGGVSWQVVDLPSETRGVTLLVSPNFAEDETVYVAGQYGTFFRSTDGGRNFQTVADIGAPGGNDAPSFVASPNFIEDGILLATGPGGIFQSSDRAETWTRLTSDPAWETRRNLQIAISSNYAADGTIFVGTDAGVFWSTDAGASWQPLAGLGDFADDYIEAIAVSPEFEGDRTLVVSIRGQGLWRSVDGGQSFDQIGDSKLLFSKLDRIPSAGMAIQFSPNYGEDNTLYAMGDPNTALYRSRDQGLTWETLRVRDLELADPSLVEQGQIYLKVYRGRILRVGLAAVLGLVSYGVLSWFTRRRTLPIPRAVIPVVGTVVIFSSSLVILFK
ncbi:MAG: VPS10 domain-containing protein [Phormidium sp.]